MYLMGHNGMPKLFIALQQPNVIAAHTKVNNLKHELESLVSPLATSNRGHLMLTLWFTIVMLTKLR